jgi:hypothetical protein
MSEATSGFWSSPHVAALIRATCYDMRGINLLSVDLATVRATNRVLA